MLKVLTLVLHYLGILLSLTTVYVVLYALQRHALQKRWKQKQELSVLFEGIKSNMERLLQHLILGVLCAEARILFDGYLWYKTRLRLDLLAIVALSAVSVVLIRALRDRIHWLQSSDFGTSYMAILNRKCI